MPLSISATAGSVRSARQPDDAVKHEARAALAAGNALMLIDRIQGRGAMVAAARHVTVTTVNQMAIWARGIIGVTVTPDTAARLGLHRIDRHRLEYDRAPVFLASVEAARGVTTGISAADRAATLQVIGDPASRPADLACPGHIVPILVSRRDGPTLPERACRQIDEFGFGDEAAFCDVLNDMGEVATLSQCADLADRLGLPLVGSAPAREIHW